MAYSSEQGTGGTTESSTLSQTGVVHSLTESQGARSESYEVAEETGRIRPRPALVSRRSKGVAAKAPERPYIAEREHIKRTLRVIKDRARDLWLADDARDAGLAGDQLTSGLKELWGYRAARETEWSEAINLLQISFAGIEFERVDAKHRLAIVRIFEDEVLTRTVGRSDVERILQLLTDGGFDVWRGLAETEFDPEA